MTTLPPASFAAAAHALNAPLRLQIAQCLMLRVSAEAYWHDDDARRELHDLIKTEGIGGVCVFQGSAVETAKMLTELQQLARQAPLGLPLLVSADFEHGVAMRLEGGTAFPQAMALGKTGERLGNTSMTSAVAQAIAREARALGVHWNFAPVCDVNSNPLNPVIGVRSFGETAEHVAEHVQAYIHALQGGAMLPAQERVMACAKHFPGHGDTAQDSHETLPTLAHSLERLEAVEFVPFRAALEASVQSVMLGHLVVPSLEAQGSKSQELKSQGASAVAASLSANVVRWLRETMGFQGVIVTDGLDMKAITKHHTPAEAAVRAFTAGVDVLLLPPEPRTALDALCQAMLNGQLQPKRVEESWRRVLQAKHWCGLLDDAVRPVWQTVSMKSSMKPEQMNNHQLLAIDAAKPALRWFPGAATNGDASVDTNENTSMHNHVGAYQRRLPSLLRFGHVAGFAIVSAPQGDASSAALQRAEEEMSAATSFFRYVAQIYHGDCDFGFVDETLASPENAADLAALLDGTRRAEVVIFAVFVRGAGSQRLKISPALETVVRHLAAGKPSVAVLFGNPYLRGAFPADELLCAFSASEPSLGAAAVELCAEG
jgi:beta-glucosidase-like glycosyl hydrolase